MAAKEIRKVEIGRLGGAAVLSELSSYGGGKYRVAIVESNGRKSEQVMSAEGMRTERDALDMLAVFEKAYANAHEGFEPADRR